MEKVIETIPVSHDGKEYEIRVIEDPVGFSFRPYLDGKPCGTRYSVSFDQKIQHILGEANPYPALVDLIKADIQNGCSEKFLARHGAQGGTSKAKGS
jgi:hypothetical protein